MSVKSSKQSQQSSRRQRSRPTSRALARPPQARVNQPGSSVACVYIDKQLFKWLGNIYVGVFSHAGTGTHILVTPTCLMKPDKQCYIQTVHQRIFPERSCAFRRSGLGGKSAGALKLRQIPFTRHQQ
jgi:hypothetical protein